MGNKETVEKLTGLIMTGNISKSDVGHYIDSNKLDKLELTNGILITRDKIGTLVAVYKDEENNTEAIGLQLFLLLNKRNR